MASLWLIESDKPYTCPSKFPGKTGYKQIARQFKGRGAFMAQRASHP